MYKLIFTVLLALISTIVYADNCDKPRDDFDGLYCLNKIYIQADKDLNEIYGNLSKKLDSEGKKLLKTSQVAWIKLRNNTCSFRDQRGFFVNLNCATQQTIERTNFLNDRHRECLSTGCLTSKLQ
ncbi:MAG: DUF1311 domain-containing protein [Desulfobacterales bacterium]|nr:DUF1311 domain-containing protein [Desulfobacterales bacterium]